MSNVVFLKLAIIFLMSIFILLIAISAIAIESSSYDEALFLLHKSVGTLFLILLPMHIYLRKKKLKKMIVEFFYAFVDTKKKQCQNNKMLAHLKKRSIEEICTFLNINIENTLLILRAKDIVITNTQETLEEIADNNANDALKIVAIILENHIKTLQKV